MAPRVEHLADGVTMILGDCRDVLPTLGGVALVVSDPPYKVTSGGFGSLEGGFSGWIKDSYDNKGSIVLCEVEWKDWLPLLPAVLRDDAHVYIFSNDRNLSAAREAAEAAGLIFHRLLVWDKCAALPNRWYQQTCEFVLFMRKGKAFMINDPSTKALQKLFQRDESEHPTEKPVELCGLYIRNSTKPGELVLDPFSGSGTTGVACVRFGRKYIGIEQDPKWFDVSCRRISDALRRPDLFAAPRAPEFKQVALL